MLLSSVFTKSVRSSWIAILGWGIGMGITVASPMASVGTLMATPAQRQQLVSIAQGFAWNADLVKVDTIGGYATFKIGVFIFLICVWPILAAARTLRAEEERGSLDVLLSLPRSRSQVAIEKVAAIWVALLAMGVIIGILTDLAGAKFGGGFGIGGGFLVGLNVALICAVVAGWTLLIAQFTQESRTASGISGGLLAVAIVVDMVHRVVPGADWFSRLSPIYYYDLNKPLIPSYPAHPLATLGLLALAVVLSGSAIWLFTRRDVGATVPLPGLLSRTQDQRGPTRTLPVRDWSVGSVYARGIRMVAWPAFWWTLGIAAWGGWITFIVQQLENTLIKLYQTSPALVSIIKTLDGGNANVNAGFLSGLFIFIPLGLMAFAVTQVSRWSADEQDGRLEMVLATPQARWSVILGRFAALATATTAISLVTLAVVVISTSAGKFSVNGSYLVEAMLGTILMALLVAAIGYLFAGWLKAAAETGLLSFVLAAWFFLSFIGPELKLPNSTLRLSPFYYYGTPLLNGLQLSSAIGLLAVAAAALAVGTYRFQRKDINV